MVNIFVAVFVVSRLYVTVVPYKTVAVRFVEVPEVTVITLVVTRIVLVDVMVVGVVTRSVVVDVKGVTEAHDVHTAYCWRLPAVSVVTVNLPSGKPIDQGSRKQAGMGTDEDEACRLSRPRSSTSSRFCTTPGARQRDTTCVASGA